MLCKIELPYLLEAFQVVFAQELATEARRTAKRQRKESKQKQNEGKPPRIVTPRVYVPLIDDSNKKVFVRQRHPQLALRLSPDCMVCIALACIFTGEHAKVVNTHYSLPEGLPKVHFRFREEADRRRFGPSYERAVGQFRRKAATTEPEEQEDTSGAQDQESSEDEEEEKKTTSAPLRASQRVIASKQREKERQADGQDSHSNSNSNSNSDSSGEEEEDNPGEQEDHHLILFESVGSSLPFRVSPPMLKVQKQFLAKRKGKGKGESKSKSKSKGQRSAESKLTLTLPQCIRACIKILKTDLFCQTESPYNELQLLPHQKGFEDWFARRLPPERIPVSGGKTKDAVLMYAAMASGKTKSIVATLSKMPWVQSVVIVTPNTMIQYWEESVKTVWDFCNPTTHFTILGYNGFEKMCESLFSVTGTDVLKPGAVPKLISDSVVVLDEVQLLRNARKSKAKLKTLYVLFYSLLTVALTATPLMNNVWAELPYLAAILKAIPFVPGTTSLRAFGNSLDELCMRVHRLIVAQERKEVRTGTGPGTGTGTRTSGKEAQASEVATEEKLEMEDAEDGEDGDDNCGINKQGVAIHIPQVSVLPPELAQLVAQLVKGKVFFYDPRSDDPEFYAKHFPKLETIRRPVEMSWVQTFYYLLGKRQRFVIGDTEIVTSSRNSYGAHERKLSNMCAEEHRMSNKVEALVADLLAERKQAHALCKSGKLQRVPSHVIKTGVIADGLLATEQCLKSKMEWQSTPGRVEVVSGATSLAKRQPIFDALIRGEVEVLGMCKIGTFGVNLDGYIVAFYLFDQGDTLQDDTQSFGRVARMDKSRDFREEPAIRVYKYISVFPRPTTRMSEVDRKTLTGIVSRLIRMDLSRSKIDLESELRAHIARERVTIDEVIEDRNAKKHRLVSLVQEEMQRHGSAWK